MPFGPLWLVASMAAMAGMSGLVRVATGGLHPFVVVFFSVGLAAAGMALILRGRRLPVLPAARRARYTVRSCLETVGIGAWYYAVAHIPLAQATALFFTLPLFVVIFAALFLRESVGWRRWAAVALGFTATLVILRPGVVPLELGALAAVLSAVVSAGSNVMVRPLGRYDPPVAIMGWNLILVTPLALAAAAGSWSTPDPAQLAWLLGIAALFATTQFCMTRAYATTEASQLAPFQFTHLVFAALVGLVAFGEVPDVWTCLGGALIAGSAIYVALREARPALAT